MRIFILSLLLLSLVVCQDNKTKEAEKEIKQDTMAEVRECVLKGEISSLFKTKLEENPKVPLVIIILQNAGKLEVKDKQVVKKCRKDIFLKNKAAFQDKIFKRLRGKIDEKKKAK